MCRRVAAWLELMLFPWACAHGDEYAATSWLRMASCENVIVRHAWIADFNMVGDGHSAANRGGRCPTYGFETMNVRTSTPCHYFLY